MESTSFYMTLPSSTKNSDAMYPDNSASAFRIQLPKTIHLKNKYEVALVEIIYPHTWMTFRSRDEFSFTFVHREDYSFLTLPITGDWDIGIAKGHYDSIQDIVRELNQSFRSDRKNASYVDNFKLYYNEITRKVRMKMDMEGEGRVKFKPGLAEILGFEHDVYYSESTVAPYTADINRGFYNLYVYCSICEPQIVGDAYVPLLRTVFITGKHGDMVQQIFHEPHYVPVNINSFDTIEINIKNDMDEFISFQSGKVICKLHFRQKAL